jgi:hypothetical protein
MRTILPLVGIFAFILQGNVYSQTADSIRKMEASGDIAGARVALSLAAESRGRDAVALGALAG